MGTTVQAAGKIPKLHILGYGVGALPVNMSFAIVVLYLSYFYTDVFLLPPAIMAVLFISCRVWDGINDPIMGLIADRTNSSWGKYRPYLLFTPIPMVVFAGLTFYAPDMGMTAKIIYAFVTYFGLQMIKTAVAVPYFALPALMTTDATERTALSSAAMIFAPVAFIIASVLTLKVVGLFPTEKEGFFYTALMFTAFSAVFSFVTFITSRKYDYPGNKLFLRQKTGSGPGSLKEKWKVISQNRPFMLSVGAFMGHNMYSAVVMGVMIYFFKYNVKAFDRYPSFIGAMLICAMLGAAIAPLLVRKFGKKSTLQGANILAICCGLTLFLLSYGKETAELAPLWRVGGPCFFLFLLSGFSSNIVPVICAAVMADSVDYGEWKTGRRTQGLISAVFLMGNKAGMALGGAFIGIGLTIINYVPNLPKYPSETLQGILVLLFIVPMGCRILISILMWFYNLSDSRFAEIVKELNAGVSNSADEVLTTG
ncbi:MAG: MFS transporter [Deltaproteobacteria bacterium]|nr:MFS transporter [Deltaproteobacteria bacterium]